MTALGIIVGCTAAAWGCRRLDDVVGDPFRRTAAFRAIDAWIDRSVARMRARAARLKALRRG